MDQNPLSREAEKLMTKLLAREKLGSKIPAETLRRYVELRYHEDRLDEAEEGFDKVAEMWTCSKETDDAELLEVQDLLGRCALQTRQVRQSDDNL
jgi:hypothetical protein